jgi:hypothetical protein
MLLELAHLAPLSNREPSSESCSQIKAIGIQKPKAIPLPARGGWIARSDSERDPGGERLAVMH